ncbi:mitochondrial carrier domain-containing protein [Schizothecium vesticola]|uniref:Mitochondrial carrier domain-containing protein n=1 Tax=Schizothecium vesticola TaxID=314040 RepID=A0AA40EVA8_9PEZI|nr:mitochondrial carrier domain-containing protein [Schizothecium vesticola]
MALSEPVEITALQKMLSATSGSLLTGLLVTPLDVVRVRWQSQGVTPPAPLDLRRLPMATPNVFQPQNLGVTACCREVFFMNNASEACLAGPRIEGITAAPAECAVEQVQQRTFNSTVDGLRKIARNEGILTLWRGLSPTLIMAVPANIIYFTGYEWLRFNRASPLQRLGLRDEYAPLAGGAIARMLAATAVSPVELFRTRLQAHQTHPTSPQTTPLVATFRGIKDMVRLDGYRALWRGLTLTLWRDVPFSGMYWLGYETIRGRLTDARERARGRDPIPSSSSSRAHARRRSQSRGNHTETFTDSFVAGAASGALASVATTPFDVGKTRTQVYRDATAAPHALAPEQRSMGRLLWHIFQAEGLAGLFKGWIPRTLKVAPACAIMISSYEVGKRSFRGVNERAMRGRERGLDG